MDQPGGKISAEEFQQMKKDFEAKYPDLTKSVLFGNHVFVELINGTGVSDIRAHFGLNKEGKLTVMFTGEGKSVDAAAKDLTIMNRGQLCPPYCAE